MRQRDGTVFARSIGGEKQHNPCPCGAGALARGGFETQSQIAAGEGARATRAKSGDRFHQLQQHSARARGMHKNILMSACADLDFVRNQAHTALLEPLHSG